MTSSPTCTSEGPKRCTNAWTQRDETNRHRYPGGYRAVLAYLRPLRTTPTAPAARPPSPRTDTGGILTHPHTHPLPQSKRGETQSRPRRLPRTDAPTGHVRTSGQMLTQPQDDQLPQ